MSQSYRISRPHENKAKNTPFCLSIKEPIMHAASNILRDAPVTTAHKWCWKEKRVRFATPSVPGRTVPYQALKYSSHTHTSVHRQCEHQSSIRTASMQPIANKQRRDEGKPVRASPYLWAPPPPRRPQHRTPPLRCSSGARLPRTAGSPPPGCLRGTGRRRSWRRWTSGSWLSPVRQATALLATLRGDADGQNGNSAGALASVGKVVHLLSVVTSPPTTMSRANSRSVSGA